jgi:hypothetical protein
MPPAVKVRDKPPSIQGGSASPPPEMSSSASSSTSVLQPAKEAGRTDVSGGAMEVTSGKESRQHGRDSASEPNSKRSRSNNHYNEGSASRPSPPSTVMEDAVGSGVSDTGTSTLPPSSPLNSTLSSSQQPPPASSSPQAPVPTAASAASASPAAPSGGPTFNADNWTSPHVSVNKLLTVNIDSRRDNSLILKVRTNSNFPGVPSVDFMQYQYDRQGKVRMAAAFLGGKQGLGIVFPNIPLFLVKEQTAEVIANQCNLTVLQSDWLGQLREQMGKHGRQVRNMEGDKDDISRALRDVFLLMQRLDITDAQPSALWSAAETAHDWRHVLCVPSTVSQDRRSSSDKMPTTNAFHLSLHLATPEATYIAACYIAAYSMIPHSCPELASSITELLASQASSSHPADSTDSSDSEDGWHRQGSDKRRTKRVVKRNSSALLRALEQLRVSPAMVADSAYLNSITSRPLLALASSVNMHASATPYISFMVDNFQSVGCDIHDLACDGIYQQISQCREEFRFPSAHWKVTQRIGGAVAEVWIREENRELMATLNDVVVSSLRLPTAALRVACSTVPKKRSGQPDWSKQRKVFLTSHTKVSPPPAQQRTIIPATSPVLSPPATTWALRLGEGVKRAAEIASLNHRPRKESKQQAPQGRPLAASSPVSAPVPPARPAHAHLTDKPAQPHVIGERPSVSTIVTAPSVNWESQLSAMESRLATFEIELTQRLNASMSKMINNTLDVFTKRLLATVESLVSRSASTLVDEINRRLPATGPRSPSAIVCLTSNLMTSSSSPPVDEDAMMMSNTTSAASSGLTLPPIASAGSALNGPAALHG